jgi:hypothetical protein
MFKLQEDPEGLKELVNYGKTQRRGCGTERAARAHNQCANFGFVGILKRDILGNGRGTWAQCEMWQMVERIY